MTLYPINNLPLIQANDDLGLLLFEAIQQDVLILQNDDILVLAQKIVSKAENCLVKLDEITPSTRALALAEITNKDPRLVEVILWDTTEVVRARPGILIVQHKLGFISANAGIDHSNVAPESEQLLLRLPPDPDASARRLRTRLHDLSGSHPPVLIIDTHGRPWRLGNVGVTIGIAGIHPLQDLRGEPDLFGTPLLYTDVGFTDQIAAAATLLMGEAGNGVPAVLVRGLPFMPDDTATANMVLRPKEKDLFR